jgi:hypothetical protein
MPTTWIRLRISSAAFKWSKLSIGVTRGISLAADQIREPQVSYLANLSLGKDDIGTENTYSRDI